MPSEPYLRAGLERPRAAERRRGDGPLRRLVARFVRVTGLLAGAIVLGLLMQDWALSGAVTAPPSPGLAARATQAAGAGAGPPAPAASTQERAAPGAGRWIAVAALAVAGTAILVAARRRD